MYSNKAKFHISYFIEHNTDDEPHDFLGSPGTVGFLRLTPLRAVSMPIAYVEKTFPRPLELRLKVFEIEKVKLLE